MLPIAYYFLQVLLCSGLMMGYYWLVLRNKRFHQYNRFYLLAVALLSWIIPLVKIRWSHPVVTEEPTMIQFLSLVANNNSAMDENLNKGFQWSWDMVASGIYFSVSFILLAGIVLALYRIYRLLQTHSCKSVGEVYLILTNAKGTPFSFFRYIFWNEEIDISSESGNQVLKHELTHVQQKHSIDKLTIQLILVAGWFNPFFWLLKKEMGMIHEFIADNRAVQNGDTASLAQMLLLAAYPRQHFLLTNPFFFSSIKRRLQMLNNQRNPRFSYVRRVIVLPLLAIFVVLFAFRNKEQRENKTISLASVVENVVNAVKNPKGILGVNQINDSGLAKKYSVIEVNGLKENIIKLLQVSPSVALKFDTTKSKQNINKPSLKGILFILDGVRSDSNILHTVEPSNIQSIDVLKDASAIAKYGEEARNGVIVITRKSFHNVSDSTLVSGQYFGKSYTNTPLYIVNGAKLNIGSTISSNDIDSVNVLKGKSAIDKYGEEGKNGVIEISTKNKNGGNKTVEKIKGGLTASENYQTQTYTVTPIDCHCPGVTKTFTVTVTIEGLRGEQKDTVNLGKVPAGTVYTWSAPSSNDGNDNKSYNVKSNEPDFNKALEMSAKGADQATTRNVGGKERNTILFTEVQTPASFPGGLPAWSEYLRRNLQTDIVKKNGGPPGRYTVIVSFQVDENGVLSNVKAINDPGYGTKEEAERVFKIGPNWKPGMQNEINVKSNLKQSITFLVM